MDSSFSMDKARIHCQTRENMSDMEMDPLANRSSSGLDYSTPEFDSYFWAKARPDLSLSQKIFTVNVA